MTKIPSIRVTETPVAVPESLQRYGLSEVVNHLLGRDPPTPFDMLVMGRFLRSSLRSVMQRHALSGEAVLEVEYLPALRQPTEAEHADQVGVICSACVSDCCGWRMGCFCYLDGCLRFCWGVIGGCFLARDLRPLALGRPRAHFGVSAGRGRTEARQSEPVGSWV